MWLIIRTFSLSVLLLVLPLGLEAQTKQAPVGSTPVATVSVQPDSSSLVNTPIDSARTVRPRGFSNRKRQPESPVRRTDPLTTADSTTIGNPGESSSDSLSNDEDGETVFYSSDTITYDPNDSVLTLTGTAVIKYGDINLKAGKIRFNTNSETLTAESLPDSGGYSIEANSEPTLEDPQGTLVGERMQYNLKSRLGRITNGRTKYEQGFFEGLRLDIEGEKTLKIHSAVYTTCDHPEHRHYWLKIGKAKVVADDKAIVKNVVAYAYGVPVFYLPFYIFPLKQGRRSGFTVPTYGSGAAEGTYVRNAGYYWAASDYWDLRVTSDFESARGFLIKPSLRYAKDRRLNGSASLSYQSSFNLKPTGWDIAATHWQELRPDLRIRGQAQFASKLAFVQSTTHGNDPGKLQSSLRSSLSVDKNWDQKSLNLSVSESSPNGKPVRPTTVVSFRLPTRPIFAQQKRRGNSGVPDFSAPRTKTEETAWYKSIVFGYNGVIRDQRQSSTVTRQELTNQANVSSQHSLGGWLQFRPQTNYSETWFRQTGLGGDRQNIYNVGVQTNTTLYGLFQPNIGRLKAIRHVLTPSVSFNQTGPRNGARSASFGLTNLFQAKTEHDGKERKFDLLTVNLASSYNFKAKTRPLSDLSTSVRVPGKTVNVDANLSHDFYTPVTNLLRRPWLQTASLNTSINLRGQNAPVTEGTGSGSTLTPYEPGPGYNTSGAFGSGGDRYDEQFDSVKGPWSVTLSHRYAISRSAPQVPFTTSSHIVTASNRFNLETLTNPLHISNPFTRLWRVEHSFNYDLGRKAIVSHSFNFYRPLHCWELYLRWTPTGFNKGIYVRLNIIAHPEIKIEQQRLR